MKTLLSVLLLIFATSTVVSAQSEKSAAKTPAPTLSTVLDHSLSNLENDVVPAADAMSEDKFDFAPSNGDLKGSEFKGVRTFAQQVKHIAATNYQIGGALLGEKPPVEVGDPNGPDNGPDSLKTKAEIVDYLKNSFAYSHKALATINQKNIVEQVQSPFGPNKASRLGLAIVTLSHTNDHYGQMVEYLRMNGIIPPASRPPQK